jgi:hypothetical protein
VIWVTPCGWALAFATARSGAMAVMAGGRGLAGWFWLACYHFPSPCPCDEQVLVAVDLVAAEESGEDGAVDAAWCAPMDIFHACALVQRGELKAGRETFGVALGGFAIDQ